MLFDINKLPPEEGILLFPVSMSRISNAQSAGECWKHLKIFSPEKIIKPVVGLNIIYSDYLYFTSSTPAVELKRKFLQLIINHKQEFLRLLSKNPMYIERAFHFCTWNQLLLESKDFTQYLGKLRKLDDPLLAHCLSEDARAAGKELDDLQKEFFLEESLLSYLLAKGKVTLRNEYIQGREQWVLYCYPGKPLKTQAYLFQKNPFRLSNSKNPYEHHFYDLSERKLYDLRTLDL